ncbi:MAG TPA: fibrobacter succinogenes major paralogous domain-containing protein [Bacteroidales bacterium]|nr:fibrobacter succinogenes major paralogous domain-containing protein [Bacteroidales bacterium]
MKALRSFFLLIVLISACSKENEDISKNNYLILQLEGNPDNTLIYYLDPESSLDQYFDYQFYYSSKHSKYIWILSAVDWTYDYELEFSKPDHSINVGTFYKSTQSDIELNFIRDTYDPDYEQEATYVQLTFTKYNYPGRIEGKFTAKYGTTVWVKGEFKFDSEGQFSYIPPNPPTVETSIPTDITSNSAICGGEIKDNGGIAIIRKGVSWSTLNNPTISDSTTNNGSGLGSFISNIIGLQPNTSYYVRAYAVDSIRTSYGNEVNLKTKPGLPVLTTTIVSSVRDISASSGGNVLIDGGANIIIRGLCWSTEPNPTIADEKTIDGNGVGIFTSKLTGLNKSTSYYYRAYAENSYGISYGDQLQFITADGTFDYCGRIYSFRAIGTQTWMTENLAYLPELNGKYFVYGYEGNNVNEAMATTNYTVYGVLYGRETSKTACPPGWHLPSDIEWETLINFLGGENIAGGKMKESGNAHWIEPNIGATNESGFTALASGYENGDFVGLGGSTRFWSTKTMWVNFSLTVYLYYDKEYVSMHESNNSANISVRCLKD